MREDFGANPTMMTSFRDLLIKKLKCNQECHHDIQNQPNQIAKLMNKLD